MLFCVVLPLTSSESLKLFYDGSVFRMECWADCVCQQVIILYAQIAEKLVKQCFVEVFAAVTCNLFSLARLTNAEIVSTKLYHYYHDYCRIFTAI